MKDLHKIYTLFKKEFPKVNVEHEALGEVVHEESGPLPPKVRWLMKVVISGASRHHIALETHIKTVPEDARARTLLAGDYASLGMVDAAEREASLAISLRPNEAIVLYNAACVFCQLSKKAEAVAAIQKAWNAGFRDPDWARRDPDLNSLHGEPEFERLYPATS